MQPPEHLLEVGRIDRGHGLRGDVVVTLITNATERLSPGTQLWAGDQPVTVRSAAPHQNRWRVTLEGVTTRDGADALAGQTLRAEPIEDSAEWYHQLIGAIAVLPDGKPAGVVVAIQDNPASDLLVLDTGALVPLVFAGDLTDGRLPIHPPKGLLELADG